MHIFSIQKKNKREYRTIYSPNAQEKTRLRLELIQLNKRVLQECDSEAIHGFVLKRSPVTNALKHVNYQYTLSADLKDFFDSVTAEMIPNVTFDQKMICFPDLAARQGLPTSPALANLAAIPLDKYLISYCNRRDIVYTRYADDLSFSCNQLAILIMLRDRLAKIISRFGFTLNEKKTRIQSSQYGRREVTGVMIDNNIHVSRSTKRKLRAALHQHKKNQAKGLIEWSRLRLPNQNTVRNSPSMKALCRHLSQYKFPGIKNKWELR